MLNQDDLNRIAALADRVRDELFRQAVPPALNSQVRDLLDAVGLLCRHYREHLRQENQPLERQRHLPFRGFGYS
jgi:hypothetical protein